MIGLNGSGKTTVLRLIQALLTPAIPDLLYDSVFIRWAYFRNKGGDVEVHAKNNKEKLDIRVSSIREPLSISLLKADELNDAMSQETQPSLFQEFQLKYSEHEYFNIFQRLMHQFF